MEFGEARELAANALCMIRGVGGCVGYMRMMTGARSPLCKTSSQLRLLGTFRGVALVGGGGSAESGFVVSCMRASFSQLERTSVVGRLRLCFRGGPQIEELSSKGVTTPGTQHKRGSLERSDRESPS